MIVNVTTKVISAEVVPSQPIQVAVQLAGAPGVGVPAGGTAGQVLAKTSAADYATAWVAAGGGGSLSDGDKGDVVVSGGGAVWSLDYGAVNATIAPAWTNITGKPTTFAPSAHNQAWSTITSTPTTLAGYGITDAQPLAAVLTGTTASFTTAKDTKLSGIATGATANSTDATLLARANHTGTQSADTLTDGTTNKAFLATERTKLAGVAAGATANSADATLLARANHTGTQLAATISDFSSAALAAIPNVTSGAAGLAPASGGGTTNFLRADGSWSAPPSGSGGVSDGDKGDVVVSGSGTIWALDYTAVNATIAPVWGNIASRPTTVSGYGITDAVDVGSSQSVTGAKTFTAPMVLGGQGTDPASPSDGTKWFDSTMQTGKMRVGGRTRDLFADLANSGAFVAKPNAGAATLTCLGAASPTAVGTITAASPATTNKHTMMPRVEYLVTTAATTAVAGFRYASGILGVTLGGASSDMGGFHFSGIWGPATGVSTTTNRAMFGVQNAATGTPTDVEPSTLLNGAWMGWDAADTNIQMMFNDATATATKVDLGASFPVPTADRTAAYKLELYSPKGTTQTVYWRVTDMVTGAVAQGSQSSDLPATSMLISPRGWVSVGGTSSVIGLALMSLYLDPLL